MHPLNDVTQLFIEFGKWRLKKLQLPCMTWQEADNDDKTRPSVLCCQVTTKQSMFMSISGMSQQQNQFEPVVVNNFNKIGNQSAQNKFVPDPDKSFRVGFQQRQLILCRIPAATEHFVSDTSRSK
jgi:hypothetical protein